MLPAGLEPAAFHFKNTIADSVFVNGYPLGNILNLHYTPYGGYNYDRWHNVITYPEVIRVNMSETEK